MQRRHALPLLFALLAAGLPPAASAVEPGYEDLPLMERIRQHNQAVQGEPERAAAPPDAVGLAPVPQARIDPFRISYLMQQKALAQHHGGPQFTPLQNAEAPELALKGIVSGGLALLEIQGSGVFLVREGDTVSFSRQGRNVVMKIEKIDRLSLMVRVGTLQEIIVVR